LTVCKQMSTPFGSVKPPAGSLLFFHIPGVAPAPQRKPLSGLFLVGDLS
jgi:hypothetical protein